MLNKELPFLRICLPLCLGIISGLHYHPGNTVCIILIVTAVFLLIITLLFNKRPANPFFGIAFICSLFIAGLILYTREKDNLSDLKQVPSVFSGEISDFPQEKQNSFMITVSLRSDLSAGPVRHLKGSIILYSKKDTVSGNLIPGDYVVIKCTPYPVTNRGNPCEFDYKFYMQSNGMKYYSFTAPGDFLSIIRPENRKISHRALIIRNRIIEMFRERGINGQRLALVSAITLGEKSHLDPDQKQYFINAGIMHIMAVSGLHAVILSYFIFGILFFLKGRLNILRILITIIFLWAFAFVTGLTPSVLRATLMFSFLQAGKLLKRPVNSINSVLASAFILILLRPSVIFDAGFLLSYSAVFYIIIFCNDLYMKLSFNHRIPDIIWQSAAVTITAQAGTLPLTIMLFNRFPTWFILTNVIIVPVSSVLIIVGCLVPMTFPLVHLSGFLARILDILTWLTEYLTETAASLPLATLNNIGLTTIECIFLTIALFLLLLYLLKKPGIPVLYVWSAFLIFSVSVTIKYYISGRNNELYVYNTRGEAAIGIKTGRLLRLYSYSDTIPKEVTRHCAVMGLKLGNNMLPPGPSCINAGNTSILITEKFDREVISSQPTDIIILTALNPFPLKKNEIILPEHSQIITLRNSMAHIPDPGSRPVNKNQIWQISRSGAYIKRL